MKQEINLYKLLPKKTGFALSPKTIGISYGVFFLWLMLLHCIALWQKHELNNQLAQQNSLTSVDQQQLTTLQQEYPVTDLVNLKVQIKQLQDEYENKAKALDYLSHYSQFSSYLIGLGNAMIYGVWITQITINREENKISLKGYTLEPTLLAQFYGKLAKQPAFSNLTFKLNEIKQTSFPASFYITATKANTA